MILEEVSELLRLKEQNIFTRLFTSRPIKALADTVRPLTIRPELLSQEWAKPVPSIYLSTSSKNLMHHHKTHITQ